MSLEDNTSATTEWHSTLLFEIHGTENGANHDEILQTEWSDDYIQGGCWPFLSDHRSRYW